MGSPTDRWGLFVKFFFSFLPPLISFIRRPIAVPPPPSSRLAYPPPPASSRSIMPTSARELLAPYPPRAMRVLHPDPGPRASIRSLVLTGGGCAARATMTSSSSLEGMTWPRHHSTVSSSPHGISSANASSDDDDANDGASPSDSDRFFFSPSPSLLLSSFSFELTRRACAHSQ